MRTLLDAPSSAQIGSHDHRAPCDAEPDIAARKRGGGSARSHRGLTFVESIAGLALLLILGLVAVPRIVDNAPLEREADTKAALGLVRSAIANHYAYTIRTERIAKYPGLDELVEAGHVLNEPVPTNPWNGSNEIREAAWRADEPPVTGEHGWNYDPRSGRFWTNTRQRHANRW